MTLTLQGVRRLVVATHNPGKVREIAVLLEGRFDAVAAGDLGLPSPVETEQTFAGNALLKARAAADAAGEVALADDSGLSVAALDGRPGVHSADWAELGGARDFAAAMARVKAEVAASGSSDRTAWFTSALAVAWPDGPAVVVEGRVYGSLVFPGCGDRGFGYDPIFRLDGHDLTFGEMDPALKDQLSHRAVAFARLRAALL
jgi:XTP/dITP diphosphohydrolase